ESSQLSFYPCEQNTLIQSLGCLRVRLFVGQSLVVEVVTPACPQRLCFCSGAFSKPRPVPRNQTLNEDKALNQLVMAPLQKHFVSGSGYML
ncbi:MAG: hypothetical protein ACK5R0_16420, partial [Bacteroidota bacterium]